MTFVGLAARNVLRNKVRTALTVLGVAIAVMTFLLLRTAVSAWTASADFAAKDRLVTRHKVTFVMPLPKRYVDVVKGDAARLGIKGVTWANWFGGRDPAHDKEFFATIAVDGATYFTEAPELVVTPAVLAAFQEDRSSAVVGDVLAAKLGWKVGDKVTLESGIYPSEEGRPWTFTIAGVYTATSRNVDRSTLLFRWDYLNEALPATRKDMVGWLMVRVNDPKRTAEVGMAIDRLFDDKEVQTLTQDERAFNQSFLAGFSAVLAALDLVSIVILGIMTLILGNTIAMGVRERTSEIATMRAIGFLPKHIAASVLGEAAVLGALGGGLGLALGYPFLEKGLGKFLEENLGSVFPFFRVPPAMAALAFVLAIALAVLASIVPARSAARLSIVDGLRKVA